MPLKCVAFDCDGVLADAVSSWRTLHDHFGTHDDEMLQRFLAGELTDSEFMAYDIKRWKEVQPRIHRDDLFRAYSGVKLMTGARETVQALHDRGVYVAIISAGVDLFVSAIASMLKVDDWIANGFNFDEDGFLQDEGECRLSAFGKDVPIEKMLAMQGIEADTLVSVGDGDVDLSMQITNSKFIGFNPSRESSVSAFEQAGVPIVHSKDVRDLWPHFYAGEVFPGEQNLEGDA